MGRCFSFHSQFIQTVCWLLQPVTFQQVVVDLMVLDAGVRRHASGGDLPHGDTKRPLCDKPAHCLQIAVVGVVLPGDSNREGGGGGTGRLSALYTTHDIYHSARFICTYHTLEKTSQLSRFPVSVRSKQHFLQVEVRQNLVKNFPRTLWIHIHFRMKN